jgi:hypothetical protein
MRRKVHVAPATFGQAADELSRVQETGVQNLVHIQFAEDGFDFGCEEGGVQCV